MTTHDVKPPQRLATNPALKTRMDAAIDACCAAYPDQRLCQIIVNATSSDPFYVEDEQLVSALVAYAREASNA